MCRTGNPTAELGALWRHVDNADRLEGLSTRIVDEPRRPLGQRYSLSEVRSDTTHRSVICVLHAILQGHPVCLGRGAHSYTVREKAGRVEVIAPREKL